MRVAPWLLLAVLVASCKAAPDAQSALDLKLVRGEPRCEKIGVVEGAGGSDEHAREDALEQAAERGATHVRLDPAHPDLDDGMSMIVTATIYRCPAAGTEFPPDGYR